MDQMWKLSQRRSRRLEYTAKVKVTVNSRGEVVSVEDNDTDTDGMIHSGREQRKNLISLRVQPRIRSVMWM